MRLYNCSLLIGGQTKNEVFFIEKSHDMSLNTPAEKGSSERASLDSDGD